MNELLDLRSDIDKPAPIRDLEPKMFTERLHIREAVVPLSVSPVLAARQTPPAASQALHFFGRSP
jgi:hypothetical protein